MSKELFEQQREFEAGNKPQYYNFKEGVTPQYSIEGIINYLADLVESVENGNSDSIVTLAKLNNAEKVLKECKAAVYAYAREEAENYPQKIFKHKGVDVEKRRGRKVYSFKHIPEWLEATQAVKDKESRYKAAYDAYQKGITMSDENGEVVPVPEVNYTDDVLVLKYVG